MTTAPDPAHNADTVRHPINCVCFDGDYCELQIVTYERFAEAVATIEAAEHSDGEGPANA